jgi:hypothetical protein
VSWAESAGQPADSADGEKSGAVIMPRKDVAVPPSRPDPIASSNLLHAPRKGSSQDYRRMVEAIQTGDLDTARRA